MIYRTSIDNEGISCILDVTYCRTPFQPEPVVGHRKISLMKLYNRVVELGGYDWVTEEKGIYPWNMDVYW
jgi:ARID/BRIGHT DNA binding domain